MLRDLLDALRCPRPHEESWLVAVIHRADGSNLLDAVLACPVCGAEFAVVDGAAHFDAPEVVAHDEALDAVRTAALLGIIDGGTVPVLLAGSYAGIGAALAALVPADQVWLNPPVGTAVPAAAHSVLTARGRAPLGVDTIAAAAVDAAHATPLMLDSIVRTVRTGGRVIAPAHVDVPSGLRTIARDAREWVAEVTTRASGLIELRRRAPDQVA